jgi:hypothetical protein
MQDNSIEESSGEGRMMECSVEDAMTSTETTSSNFPIYLHFVSVSTARKRMEFRDCLRGWFIIQHTLFEVSIR